MRQLKVGVKGSTRPMLLASLCVSLLATTASGAQAGGATYTVLKCHDSSRSGSEGVLSAGGGYKADNFCTAASARYELKSTGYGNLGGGARLTFTAPGGTSFSAVALAFDGRTSDGHYAQVVAIQGGGTTVLHRAPNQLGGYVNLGPFSNLAAEQIVVELTCQNRPPCAPSEAAHAWVRNVELRVRDNYDPGIGGIGGSLVERGGWLRGGHTLSAASLDYGSGMRRLSGYVNGVEVASGLGGCGGALGWPYAFSLVPCGGGAGIETTLDTSTGPFRNGANTVVFRAEDYPGNTTWSGERMALVDNAPPSLAFADSRDPDDPELIVAAVSDDHSGLASARIQMRALGASDWQALETQIKNAEALARVNSSSLPAGEYEFRVEASDVAGNAAASTSRRDGTPMRLAFPLKSVVDLQAHLDPGGSPGQTVSYGTESTARGRLLDSAGDPMSGKEIAVVEHFGEGALIRERVSRVRTDEEGSWDSKIPAGPSRRVEAVFGGTSKYAPTEAGAGAFTVRSGASFRTSRRSVPEGRRVVFKGRVHHFGARIPAGGKLIELQVRVRSGRWDTVREAFRTDPGGGYKLSYRFGKQYASDTLFRFRVKVRREANWPFKRTATEQRSVVVEAR